MLLVIVGFVRVRFGKNDPSDHGVSYNAPFSLYALLEIEWPLVGVHNLFLGSAALLIHHFCVTI